MVLMFDFRTVYNLFFERGINLLEIKSIFLDNEYAIMSEITDNKKVTQRELSKKLGVSVSTINILINKMIREGLIKMTQVSQKQVMYMLTPMGMMEKTSKTIKYLKVHYRAIYETKRKIRKVLDELAEEHDKVFLWINDIEIREIVNLAISEFELSNINCNMYLVEDEQQIDLSVANFPVLLYMEVDRETLEKNKMFSKIEKINLTERI